MATELDRENEDNGMRITAAPIGIRIHILIVDAASPGYFVMDCARPTDELRFTGLAAENRRRVHQRRGTRCESHVVVELLRTLEADVPHEFTPNGGVLTVDQDSVAGLVNWPPPGTRRRFKG